MDPVLCLLPTPLLGPACWRPVAAALAAGGWPVTTLASEHLHMLVNPAEVAAALIGLVTEIG